jgi:hypothetical protein
MSHGGPLAVESAIVAFVAGLTFLIVDWPEAGI